MAFKFKVILKNRINCILIKLTDIMVNYHETNNRAMQHNVN